MRKTGCEPANRGKPFRGGNLPVEPLRLPSGFAETFAGLV